MEALVEEETPSAWLSQMMQLVKRDMARFVLAIAPPSLLAQFPWNEQFVKESVEPSLLIAPPMPLEEFPWNEQLVMLV